MTVPDYHTVEPGYCGIDAIREGLEELQKEVFRILDFSADKPNHQVGLKELVLTSHFNKVFFILRVVQSLPMSFKNVTLADCGLPLRKICSNLESLPAFR